MRSSIQNMFRFVASRHDIENPCQERKQRQRQKWQYSSGSNDEKDIDGGDDEEEEEFLLLRGVLRKPVSKQQRYNTMAACSFYSFCSICMALVNKSLANSNEHLTVKNNCNTLIVAFQALVALLCIHFCQRAKWVECPTLTMATARCWAPVTLCFCLMVYTGITAWQTTNSVRIMIFFKSVSNLYITAGDFRFLGNKPTDLVVAVLSVMLVGTAAAASNDIATTPWNGLGWMAANCLCTTGYVLILKRASQTTPLSKFGMVYVYSLLCLLFLLPVAWYRGEVVMFVNARDIHTTGFFVKNVLAGMSGFLLTLASSHCISATSPTTYAVVGSISNIPVAVLGWLLFDSLIVTWLFICVSMVLGGWLFSFAMIQPSSRRENTAK